MKNDETLLLSDVFGFDMLVMLRTLSQIPSNRPESLQEYARPPPHISVVMQVFLLGK
jgi:hypothetical protein